MFLIFPAFNLYSTPLLILIIQGLIFAFLLLYRFAKYKYKADFFVGLLLILTAYHRTAYTIGFMDWYDTFRNTKVNYFLVSFTVLIGPLIYFYVKSLVQPTFKFKRKHFWHFLPAALQLVYCIIIYVHDAGQPGFKNVQNGEWFLKYNMNVLSKFFETIDYTSYLLYFTFTIQLFNNYKKKIEHFFSNTYKIELNWIRNFLAVYVFLIAFSYLIEFVGLFVDLRWTDRWWIHFLSSIALVYLGIKAYFTELSNLYQITNKLSSGNKNNNPPKKLDSQKEKINNFIHAHKPFLNTELTLPEMAKQLGISTNELSMVINKGYKVNFNDFINNLRIEEFKIKVKDPANAHLSLLGLAMDCGFSSKATFNRVFKKFTSHSPSEYLKLQQSNTS